MRGARYKRMPYSRTKAAQMNPIEYVEGGLDAGSQIPDQWDDEQWDDGEGEDHHRPCRLPLEPIECFLGTRPSESVLVRRSRGSPSLMPRLHRPTHHW